MKLRKYSTTSNPMTWHWQRQLSKPKGHTEATLKSLLKESREELRLILRTFLNTCERHVMRIHFQLRK
jgi:hypothetical protein